MTGPDEHAEPAPLRRGALDTFENIAKADDADTD